MVGVADGLREAASGVEGFFARVWMNWGVAGVGQREYFCDIQVVFDMHRLDVLRGISNRAGAEARAGPVRHPAVEGDPIQGPIDGPAARIDGLNQREAAERRHPGKPRVLASIGQGGSRSLVGRHLDMVGGLAQNASRFLFQSSWPFSSRWPSYHRSRPSRFRTPAGPRSMMTAPPASN